MRWVRTGQGIALALAIALASAALTAIALYPKHVSGAAVPPLQPVAASTTFGAANTLTVVGQGSGSATPDQATVSLGVSATRGSVGDALNVAGGEMTTLINSLHSSGVQDKDIQTSGVTASQDTNCCPRQVISYTASGWVNVLIHHLNNVSVVITAAVGAVGNDIQLNGVNLSVSDTSAGAKDARSAAMADAASRAGSWASLSGKHLGSILAVSEEIGAPVYGGGCGGCGPAYGAGGGGIPIQPGQSQITLSVSVVYEIS